MSKLKKLLLGGSVVVMICGVVIWAVTSPSDSTPRPPEIKNGEQATLGTIPELPETLKLADGELTHKFESPAYETDFEFNAIAPHWKETASDAGAEELRTMQVRVSSDKQQWSDWFDVEAEGPLRDDDPHPDTLFPEAPIFAEGKYFQYTMTIGRPTLEAKAPEISDLNVTYIDSREKPKESLVSRIRKTFGGQAYADQEQGPPIVDRASWGSPDPYGQAFRGTDQYWRPTYEPVTQIFLHHTVNSNNSSDFSAVVRGIWQFHTYTRGWGDIGYNYLVDGNGVVYEGRFGGDNVVGGHVLGYNQGSMGVGLIGCFQHADSDCRNLNGGNFGPSGAMLDGLYNLLGWKTKTYEIDPRGSHTFCGNQENAGGVCLGLANISGHRDAGQTSCPGSYVYDNLPTIREAAESRRANLFPYAAKQLTFGKVTTTSTGEKSVTLSFKNTGNTTWRNDFQRVFLKTANPDDRSSSFQGSGWITSQHAALLNESSVPPGGTGTFTFNVDGRGKPPETFYEGFRLVVEGVTNLKSYFTVPIEGPTYKWALTSLSHSSGTALMSPGETQQITIVAKNVGTATWYRTGDNPHIRLGTWPPDRGSNYFDASWASPFRPAGLQEASVAPNQNGTFVFTVKAPSQVGEYGELFNLVAEGVAWAAGGGTQVYIRVVGPYNWEPVSLSHSTGTANIARNTDFTLTLKARNTGSQTWQKAGSFPVRLGTVAPQNRGSGLFHPSWITDYRPVGLLENSVAPGGIGTFVFTARTPSTPGQRFERFSLLAEGTAWFNDPGFLVYVNVL